MDGSLIDFGRRQEVATREVVEALLEWATPAREVLGLEVALPEANGAQRARQALEAGSSIEAIYRGAVAETQRTYVAEEVSTT
jgi:carboxylate-amine ligase